MESCKERAPPAIAGDDAPAATRRAAEKTVRESLSEGTVTAMSARQATRKTLRAAIAFALTYFMVWGGMPAPALAEMAEEAMGTEPVAAPATSRGDANGKTSSPVSTGQTDTATTTGGEGELGTDVAPAAPVEGGPGSTPAAEAPANTDGELGVQSESVPDDSNADTSTVAGTAVLSTQSVSVSNPRVVADSNMDSGQVTTWDCVWLGSYPQAEVAAGDAAYEALQAAEWVDGDATVDGVRYRRISRDDATRSDYWPSDASTYRYFRYEPIKWRVLKVDVDTALVVADVALDCRQYHNKSNASVTWEASAVRSWLNGTGSAPYYSSGAQSGHTAQAFAEVAFTTEQLGAVQQSTIANADNMNYNTLGGNDTTDSIFLLSESEVRGASATAHGFVSSPGTDDEARRCKATDYAHAMGAQVSADGSGAGNCYWWLRSPGEYANHAAYVLENGSVICFGFVVENYHHAVRPALNFNLSSPHPTWAGTVSSDGAVYEPHPITSVEVAEAGLTYDGGEKRPAVTVWSNGLVVPEAGYDLTYVSNVAAGTATVRAVGKGIYEGEAQAMFEIERRPVTVKADDQAKALGDPDPEFTATADGLLDGDTLSYTFSRAEGDALGEYAITPSGDTAQGNYAVTYVPGTLTIATRNDVVRAGIAPIPDQTFTGSAIEPQVAVTLDGVVLVAGTDYDVTYANNVNAGTATVTIAGKGSYTGTKDVGYSIAPKPVEPPAAAAGLVYDGTERTGVPAGEGYVLSGDVVRRDAGAYTATATLDANHAWSDGSAEPREVRWSIAPKPVTVTAENKTKAYGEADPALTATADGLLGSDAVSYELSRAPGEDAGEYAITPSGEAVQGNYAVTYVPGKLTITPAPIATGRWGTCPWDISAEGVLTVRPGEGASQGQPSASPWSDYASSITSVVFTAVGDSKVVLPENSNGLLRGLDQATSMDLSGADTSRVAYMSSMFNGCSNLATLDLAGWNTSRVTNMGFMFSDCTSLSSLDLAGWDTSKVTKTLYMYHGCSSLATLNLSSWDTSKVTSMSNMFNGCSNLAALNLSGWDTSEVTDMTYMFQDCSSLASLDLAGWDTSKVTSMSFLFDNCSSLGSLNLSDWDTSKVTLMGAMFSGCSSLTAVGDISDWETSSVTGMGAMFSGCSSLGSLDLSGWDTSKVTSMGSMFSGCSSLTTVGDISDWETSSVTDMGGMFSGCSSLKSLDPSGWDTSNVTTMYYTFYNCSSLKSLDLSGWDTSKVTIMGLMFDGCSLLESLDLSDWTLGSVVPRFSGLSKLVNLDVAGWDTSQVTDTAVMFSGCSSLESLDLSSWDTSKVTTAGSMFYNCPSLRFLKVGAGYEIEGADMLPNATAENGKWWSVSDQAWYTKDEIVSGRTGVADIYTSYQDASVYNADVMFGPDVLTYSGTPFEPVPTVILGSRVLVHDTDFTCSYADNVNAGVAKVTITGAGGFTGSKIASFEIAPRPVSVVADNQVKVSGDNDPTLTATVEGVVGNDTVSYSVSRVSGEALGEYAITPAGEARQGNYAVTYVPGTLTITKDVANAKVTLPDGQVYSGEALTPVPTVTLGARTLDANTDYDVSYASNVNAGTATVTVTGKGNYAGTKNVEFLIARKPVEVPAAATGLVYDGTDRTGVSAGEGYALTGDVVRRDAGAYTATATLDSNHAWAGGFTEPKEISWSIARKPVEPPAAATGLVYDGTDRTGVPAGEGYSLTGDVVRRDAGAYTATATLDSNHAWAGGSTEPKEISWSIARKSASVSGKTVSKVYGSPDPELVTVEGLVGEDTISYEVIRAPGDAVGDYAITPSGAAEQGNYAVTYTPGKMTIVQADVSSATVDPMASQLHTGSAIEPKPVVRMGDITLVEDTDYDLSYANNVDPGTATVTIAGKGNYTGTTTAEFSIGTKMLSDAEFYLDRELFPASAVPAEPTVSVFAESLGKYLVEGSDFAVSYRDNDKVGQAAAVVTGLGDWVGTVELPFEVVEKVDISDQRSRVLFWLGADSFVYRGSPVRPPVKPSSAAATGLVEGRDYSVGYLACDGPGNAVAVVTGTGDYTGEVRLPYTILAPSSVNLSTASVTVGKPCANGQYIGSVKNDSDVWLATYLYRAGADPRPVPTVTADGALLEAGKDYSVKYVYGRDVGSSNDMALVQVDGINGVTGSAICAFRMVESANVAWLGLGTKDLQQPEYLWEGTAVTPQLVPREGFVKDVDYRLSYRGNDGTGTCTVTVTGIGRFYGSVDIQVPVVENLSFTPLSQCAVDVIVPEGGFTYTGEPIEPEVRVTDPATGKVLARDKDYRVSFVGNVNAGAATAQVVTAPHNGRDAAYAGYNEATFQIAKAPSKMTATVIKPQVAVDYNVQTDQFMPSSNIAAQGAWRHETYANVSSNATAKKFWIGMGTGFLTVPKGTAPGSYKLDVKVTDEADGNHVGKAVTLSYTVVVRCPVAALAVTAPQAQTYTGRALTPRPGVRLGSTALREGSDYTLAWRNNVNAGMATVTVTGKGNYTGSRSVTFRINPANVSAAAMTVSPTSCTYDGRAKTPGVTVKFNGATLVFGRDFSAAFANNVNAGTATVKVTGKGNFTGSKSATFRINPAQITSVSVSPATFTYDGKAKTPGVTVKAGGLTVPASGYTVKYANNVNAGTATVTVTGKGNFTGSKGATFRVNPAAITSVSVSPASYTYDGKAKTPGVTVKAGGLTVPASGYTVKYDNNVNAGTATVTVTGKGSFTGSKGATFRINPAAISAVSVSPAGFEYDGKAKTPGVAVKAGGLTVPASGYNVSYKDNTDVGTATATVTGRGNFAGSKSATFSIAAPARAGVTYQTHVQNIGDQGWRSDGAEAGTHGMAYRLEAIRIRLEGAHVPGSIEYRTHVQNIGWQDYRRDGAEAGTHGLAYRLEAIQIRLTGEMARRYDVWYCVHAQDVGDMGWAKNDAPAGTAGFGRRLEAIRIVVLPKGSPAPGRMHEAFVSRDGSTPAQSFSGHAVRSRTHVQDLGWQGWATDGQMSGTQGMAKRLEGIEIALCDRPAAGSIEYRTHVQNIGWQGYVRDGQMSGTSGRALRLEAIQLRLTGAMGLTHDVWYRVHAQNFGWMGWARNDQQAGTAGFAYRLEGIEILVLPKGAPAPGPTAGAFRQR